MHVYVCVCVCVKLKGEREREREKKKKNLGTETDRLTDKMSEADKMLKLKGARLKTYKMSETDRETVPVLQGVFLPGSTSSSSADSLSLTLQPPCATA